MITDESTIREGREWLRSRLADGDNCPLCRQRTQVYWRTINAGMAVSAIRMLREHQRLESREFLHLPTLIGRQSDEAKLRYWGLLEESPEVREDGSRRSGWWRLTERGMLWTANRLAVPRYAQVFCGDLVRLDRFTKTGRPRPDITVVDSLGAKFSYQDLMRGEA